jgi:hypothetical protein
MGHLILALLLGRRVSWEKFTGPEVAEDNEVVKTAAVLVEEEVKDPFELEEPDGEIDVKLIVFSPVVESGKSGLVTNSCCVVESTTGEVAVGVCEVINAFTCGAESANMFEILCASFEGADRGSN